MYDCLVYNVKIVDVGLLEVRQGWFGIREGRVWHVGTGNPKARCQQSKHGVDGHGQYAVPSLIDAHMHIESSFVTPRRFVEAAVPAGTGCILADPHEIANVAGIEGIKYLVESSKNLPMDIFFAIPSCVPATSVELETPGAVFDLSEVRQVRKLSSRFIALGEVMDYVSLLQPDSRASRVLQWARAEGLIIDGHCPSLTGLDRQTYFARGVQADHTLMWPEKIREEVSAGIWVQLQEKSLIPENISVLKGLRDISRILLVTDDYSPSLFYTGHLNSIVRKAIKLGLEPLQAIAAATVRPARYLRLPDQGMIAPGKWANFFLTDDLTQLRPHQVYFRGKLVAEGGILSQKLPEAVRPSAKLTHTVHAPAVNAWTFTVPLPDGCHRVPAVTSNGVNTETGLEEVTVRVRDGEFQFAEEDSLNLAAVLRRHGDAPGLDRSCSARAKASQEGRPALCLLKGFGPRRGAIASTVAHDSHNLVVIGRSAVDMALAVNSVREQQGGMVAVVDGQVISRVELPIAGLLTDQPVWSVAESMAAFEQAMQELGVKHERALTFFIVFSLTVSPHYKLSDRGLVDVNQRRIIANWPCSG